jgi:hypothetical protein
VSLDRCGGCGEVIRPGEQVYDYYDPKRGPEAVARCHSGNPACLIAWNERWHAAEGREYDTAIYRRLLDEEPPNRDKTTRDQIVTVLTDEQRAAVAAIEDAIARREHFTLQVWPGQGKALWRRISRGRGREPICVR